jgi:Tat protein secretion system quality control protein TatD with DNase activity
VIPAVEAPAFEGARALAHQLGDAYALGIHPMCVARAADDALAQLDAALTRHAADPRLVAVGEIGLDYFVPELAAPGPLRARQEHFYREQLKLARRHGLPVILHVRRSVDAILQGLREIEVAGGIAHAFGGSRQQADQFLQLGFKLGFGGALTYERATRLRALATALPAHAIVMETDAPTSRRNGCTPAPPSVPRAPPPAATSQASCRASPPCWPACARCRSRPGRRRPPPTPARRCRGWRRWWMTMISRHARALAVPPPADRHRWPTSPAPARPARCRPRPTAA